MSDEVTIVFDDMPDPYFGLDQTFLGSPVAPAAQQADVPTLYATAGPYDYSSPSTRFYMDYSVSQNQGGNYSVVNITIRCYNGPSGSTASNYGGSGTQSGTVDGVGGGVSHSATPFLPSGYSANQLRWSYSGGTSAIGHDANGNHGNVTVRLHIAYGSINQDFTFAVALPRIPKAPAQVAGVAVGSPTTTGLTVTWAAPNNNGSAITNYDLQWSVNADMSGATLINNMGTGLSKALTGLAPGTNHYVQVRAENAVGTGAWSSVASGATLPSVPPGLTVVASPSGTQATLTFSPPGGVTGVDHYTWERRVFGTTTPVATDDSAGISTVVTGLTPGTKYEWRASAWIGSYQSPVSAWQAVTQPKPNTNPGDYFDGNTADSADLDYAWTGTVNDSTSTATAQVPIGWEVQFSGTGQGVIYRVTAGEFGPFAARVVVTVDASVAGVRMGQKNATGFQTQVVETATYVGSIYAYLSRSNSIAAEITWLNAAGGVISRSQGAPVNVPGGTWFRLATAGVAPSGAVLAVVRIIDVAGGGWSLWRGGDQIDLDGAMISLNEEFDYFDGDTLPDGDYVYAWTGASNASTSTRTPVNEASASTFGGLDLPSGRALIDPDCAPVPAPPRPPTIPSDCIVDNGVWRRYYAEIPSIFVSDWLAVVPTLEVTTGSAVARQVRVRYYPNPLGQAPSAVDKNSWCAEQIISFMPAKTTMTIDGVTQRVWAEVNGSDAISADHLLYGTGGKPATWPILSCGIGYVISLEVPTDAPAGNINTAISLTTRT